MKEQMEPMVAWAQVAAKEREHAQLELDASTADEGVGQVQEKSDTLEAELAQLEGQLVRISGSAPSPWAAPPALLLGFCRWKPAPGPLAPGGRFRSRRGAITCNRQEEQKKAAEHDLGELFSEQDRLTKETQQAAAAAKEPQKNMKQVSEQPYSMHFWTLRTHYIFFIPITPLAPLCPGGAQCRDRQDGARRRGAGARGGQGNALAPREHAAGSAAGGPARPHPLRPCTRAPVHLFTSPPPHRCTRLPGVGMHAFSPAAWHAPKRRRIRTHRPCRPRPQCRHHHVTGARGGARREAAQLRGADGALQEGRRRCQGQG